VDAAARAAAAAVDIDVVAALRIELSQTRAMARQTAEEHQRLVEENGRLIHELSAFDLSFWEELEDLKYAHQQALRQVEEARGKGREGERVG
jgi:alkanesulfonate monooxygenase SsuD/methylene tetrahydromethanopterin reductase-like flavin-dependent oxidoreductase (luciferase family)